MTSLVHFLPTLHVLVAAAAAKKTSSSTGFIVILLIIAVGAYLFMRPRQRRQREQLAQQRAVEPGDEVVTAAGIVGRVQSLSDDRVRVEIAPGTTIEVVRKAIGTKITPPAWDNNPPAQQWDVPASSDNPGATGDSGEHTGFPAPSPKPDPDEDHSAEAGGEAQG